MANIFKELWTRINIDWMEWRAYQASVWNVKRDRKQIERAIERARLKNLSDGRTYYILRNVTGGFDEVNSEEIKRLRAKKIDYFPRYKDINSILTESFAIVTNNNIQRNSYIETINSIQNNQSLN